MHYLLAHTFLYVVHCPLLPFLPVLCSAVSTSSSLPPPSFFPFLPLISWIPRQIKSARKGKEEGRSQRERGEELPDQENLGGREQNMGKLLLKVFFRQNWRISTRRGKKEKERSATSSPFSVLWSAACSSVPRRSTRCLSQCVGRLSGQFGPSQAGQALPFYTGQETPCRYLSGNINNL